MGLLYFNETDAIANIEAVVDDPNDRKYTLANLGTWSSISDVDIFLSRFNHDNNYKDGDTKLSVGNYVTIQDGTYNAQWMIAGFNMEAGREAADGTIYDNGYGICLIPHKQVTTAKWNNANTVNGAYRSSTMHTTHLPNIVSKLQTILGSHIVTRNVLLSSRESASYQSNDYTWTTAYATLMSVGQMTGGFAANWNKYDDGEANYKLPIFNYKEYKTDSAFWTRNVWGTSGGNFHVWYIDSNGSINGGVANSAIGVRPLIYIR